jgi:predicted alpha/beta hydrolase
MTRGDIAGRDVAEPRQTVRDPDGLWSFSVYGETTADTAMIVLPALGVPARFYAPLLREWLRDDNPNVAVVVADFIAGDVRPNPNATSGRTGFASLVEGCIKSIFDTVAESLPEAAPVLAAHSLGGQLGMIAAARYAPQVPVVLTAAGSAEHRCFPGLRRWAGLFGGQAIGLVSRVAGHWPGDRLGPLGFGGRQPGQLMLDWAYTVRTGKYRAATGSFDYEAALGEYRGNVLAITMTGDLLAPWPATAALLAKTNAATVTRQAYTPSRGAGKPGPHFTWVKDAPRHRDPYRRLVPRALRLVVAGAVGSSKGRVSRR